MAYFIILNCQDGSVTPMMEGDDLALFESVPDAMICGYESPLGKTFGFEIFELGGGESY